MRIEGWQKMVDDIMSCYEGGDVLTPELEQRLDVFAQGSEVLQILKPIYAT